MLLAVLPFAALRLVARREERRRPHFPQRVSHSPLWYPQAGQLPKLTGLGRGDSSRAWLMVSLNDPSPIGNVAAQATHAVAQLVLHSPEPACYSDRLHARQYQEHATVDNNPSLHDVAGLSAAIERFPCK